MSAPDFAGCSIDLPGVSVSPEPQGGGLIVDATVGIEHGAPPEWIDHQITVDLQPMTAPQLRTLAAWCTAMARHLERHQQGEER